MCKHVQPLKIVDLRPGPIEKFRAVNDDGKTLGAADRNIEAVQVEQKLSSARRFRTVRRRHRYDHDGGFLPLEFVHGSDFRARRQTFFQEIDLKVIGRDHEDIVEGYRGLYSISRDALRAEIADELRDDIRLGTTRLRAPVVFDRRK